MRRALFLDRDGTLVHPRHYPSRPEDLILYKGIAPGLVRLQEMNFLIIVITNQAGIARGLFTESDLHRLHDHLRTELQKLSVRTDAIYHCPHHPQGIIPDLAIACECRKPRPGMLMRAVADFDIDLTRSWFVGDILDDVEAGNRAGCRTVLVDLGTESLPDPEIRRPDFVARDTPHALDIIQVVEGVGSMADLTYRPTQWVNAANQPLVAAGE